MEKDFCGEIANIISGYRMQERAMGQLRIDIDRYHVEKWVSQFNDNQDVILEETLNLIREYYFSEEDILAYLEGIFSSEKIWGNNIEQSIANSVFLDCQSKGGSQHRLYNESRDMILNMYDIDIDDCCEGTNYIYIDDCMFSGSTLRKDLLRLSQELPYGSTVTAIFVATHSFAEWWVKKVTEEALCQNNIKLCIWRLKTIQNSGGRNYNYECLWPKEYNSERINQYLEIIEHEGLENPEKKVRLFRDDLHTGGVYTSEENRIIFEHELMEAGLKIMSFSENPKPFIRPMGFDNRISFGFGAFFATYMNMSNNCPLAFWWGDPSAHPSHPFSKWYPLLPRKANDNGRDFFVWE